MRASFITYSWLVRAGFSLVKADGPIVGAGTSYGRITFSHTEMSASLLHYEPVRPGHAQQLRRHTIPRQFHIPDQQFFSGWSPEAVVAATPNFRRDARYRMASGYQDRRSIRLQAKFSF
jgi:hypothetical protein